MIRKNWLEWVTLTISSIVVLATFGYLTWLAVNNGNGHARLSADVGEIRRNGDDYDVSVFVNNDGETSAEQVHVEVTLDVPGKETEKASLSIQYVPYHSRRDGTVTFQTDPRFGTVEASVRAYQNP